MSTGAREWVTMTWLFWVFERSGLCFLGMFAKGNRGERERKDCQIESFKILVTVTVQFRRDRREVKQQKLLTCRCVKTTPFGDHFPPKSPTRHRFGDHFPPKAQHGTVLGIYISPQKPTRRRFRDQLSHQIAHVGPAFFLSFLVSFLFWFGLNGLGFLSNLKY